MDHLGKARINEFGREFNVKKTPVAAQGPACGNYRRMEMEVRHQFEHFSVPGPPLLGLVALYHPH